MTAEILSFERGQKLLRPAGTYTAALWRRNKRWAPLNTNEAPEPPAPRYA